MLRPLAIAAGLLCWAPPYAHAEPGSMRLPISAADLAGALGIARVDPSTLPLDIVRLAFASPDGANEDEAAARASLARALNRQGSDGDLVPLPLSADIWREHVLRDRVADDRLAAAIFGARGPALLYHGLLGVDSDTLAWMERNPAIVEVLLRHAAIAAVYARSIRVRDGAIVTPGEDSVEIWAALAGADPRRPSEFIARLLSVRDGRLAVLFDTIAHLDPAHQAFAIGRQGDPSRIDRARRLLGAVSRQQTGWRIDDRPFLRPDVDASLLLRIIAVDESGTPRPPASRALWAAVFGTGAGGGDAVDAGWLADAILDSADGTARRRLDTFRFAQRTLGSNVARDSDLISVLRHYPSLTALMLTLEANGVTDPATYAAAARAAASVERHGETLVVFQSGLAILDSAGRAGTLPPEEIRSLVASLVAAGASRPAGPALVQWISGSLMAALRRAVPVERAPSQEALLLAALAGPPAARPIAVRWEGQDYTLDIARGELQRLARIRRSQNETPLDAAIARAARKDPAPLANSLAALVYATAIGEADSPALIGGAVWRRHRFGGGGPGQRETSSAWRIATEVFGAGGWHLTGSLLRLDLALAHLALKRLDESDVPAPSVLSTSDRRTMAMSVALANPRGVSDEQRDAIAAALARGRRRSAELADQPGALEAVAADAPLSEWRRNAIAWLIAHDKARVPSAFTVLEQYRLGGGAMYQAWGTTAGPLDGCLCLRMPDRVPWEEHMGRASTGRLGTQLADVMLRIADLLSARRLPAALAPGIAAFAMQDALDRGRPAYFDDWLPMAFAVRDQADDRFDDCVAALTVSGPLVPLAKTPIQ